jgi:DNA-binding CsgD family transcriptional regulator
VATLEDCTVPGCSYRLDFDVYALGESQMSAGNCPTCGGGTNFFCPACGRLQPTRDLLAAQFACSGCDARIEEVSKHRKIVLTEDCTAKRFLMGGTRLAPREVAVLKLLAEGRSNKEIAVILTLTVRTVDAYRTRIMWKANLHSVVELVHYALAYKVVSLERITERFFSGPFASGAALRKSPPSP